jgi:hypothetical protein
VCKAGILGFSGASNAFSKSLILYTLRKFSRHFCGAKRYYNTRPAREQGKTLSTLKAKTKKLSAKKAK